jgi:hypothetical protein
MSYFFICIQVAKQPFTNIGAKKEKFEKIFLSLVYSPRKGLCGEKIRLGDRNTDRQGWQNM